MSATCRRHGRGQTEPVTVASHHHFLRSAEKQTSLGVPLGKSGHASKSAGSRGQTTGSPKIELYAEDANCTTAPHARHRSDTLTNTSKSLVSDAEADGRVIVKVWAEIGELGVFAGSAAIAAAEVLGRLKGIVAPRQQRLTRAERRRFIGIFVDGRAAHIDVQGSWPERINHAPPSECNVDWDPDTRLITATRAIQAGEQLFFDYHVGYWVDKLMDKDYEKLAKDQREFFDLMHAVVRNYGFLSQCFNERRLGQAMRMRIIEFYVFQQSVGNRTIVWLPLKSDDKASSCIAARQEEEVNPLLQYLHRQGIRLQFREEDEENAIVETTSPGIRPAPLELSDASSVR